MDNQRNLILAVVLSGLLIFGWDFAMRTLYPEATIAGQTEQSETGASPSNASPSNASPSNAGATPLSGSAAGIGQETTPSGPVELASALASPARISIDAPRVEGSINLVGARIDDIELKDHRESIEETSGPVQIFAPRGTSEQYFAEFGWIGDGIALPNSETLWQADRETLTATDPVTLSWDNSAGQVFTITLAIDENYMITAGQKVVNSGDGQFVVRSYGLLNRTVLDPDSGLWIAHTGPIGGFGDAVEYGPDYDDLVDSTTYMPEGKPDWLGFSDTYWLGALIPGQDAEATPGFRSLGENQFRADVIYAPVTVPAGGAAEQTTRLFAGAKESVILDQYQDDLGIARFGKAIDWGWFEWFVKPMVWLLRTLYDFVGNFGVAIILLTVLIRGLLFPIAQKQFSSMAAMKAVQPKMKAIQERYKDDKQKQQQEIMKLYKDEKVNPLAGCLPLLVQIPIFFALYKALILAIDMRHKPFLDFWIKDLSAPDPWTILNLFGLLPFEVPGFLGIGVLAVLLGVTMWLTFKMNPSAMDPVQQQIFNLMPWILMFVMAPFAAGLLLYWVTSNVLTLAQQTYLYSKHPQLRAAAEKEKADKAREKAKGDA
ncbi:MAG: membrane protein insertase YidC [Erythrobacter sp.]